MTEKKSSYRNITIGVGVLCGILLIALAYSVVIYNSMLRDKDAQIASLNSQIATLGGNPNPNTSTEVSDLQAQIASLQKQLNDLQSQLTQKNADINSLNSQISSLTSQINSLNSQLDSLKAANVVEVNLKSDDSRPFLGTPNLHVYGELCNVGTNTANNVKLHVVAYQSGGVVAIDTYILVGSMNGESWTSVDGAPTYGGGSLTSWTITPEWT
jgi:Tfp pilus assembly protein PilN